MSGFNFFGMWTDIPFQWSNLLFLTIPVGKAIYDVFFKEKKGIGVNHRLGISVAILSGFFISLADWFISDVTYYAQSAFLCAACFLLIFDYLRNKLAGQALTYVDSNPSSDPEEDSWFDVNVYSKFTPLSLFFIKGFIFIVAMSLYYLTSYL